MMGIKYLDNTWLVRQPDEEARWDAATADTCAGGRYYVAASVTLLASIGLMAAPVAVALLAIAGILR